MPASDVVLYAEWTTNPTYTVTYHGHGADGGDVPVDTNSCDEGDSVTVSRPGRCSSSCATGPTVGVTWRRLLQRHYIEDREV